MSGPRLGDNKSRMRAGWLLVFLSWPLLPGYAQDSPKAEALQWSIALSGRFRELRDPVVAAHAMANLGALVCAHDRIAGAALFQDALSRLRILTPESFRLPNHILPVASFTVLWSTATSNAAKCDPALEQFSDAERAWAKMSTERQQANATLERGISLIEDRPDRAAQLAESAMSASDPSVLDADQLTEFLSKMRDRAPDLADDVFSDALDFLTAKSADGRLVSPASAYSLAVQMLQDSRDVPLELVAELQKIIQGLSAQARASGGAGPAARSGKIPLRFARRSDRSNFPRNPGEEFCGSARACGRLSRSGDFAHRFRGIRRGDRAQGSHNRADLRQPATAGNQADLTLRRDERGRARSRIRIRPAATGVQRH